MEECATMWVKFGYFLILQLSAPFGDAGLAQAHKYTPERVTIGTRNHYIYLRVFM